MTFLAPTWFALVAVPVALAVAYLAAQRRRARYAVRFTELHLLSTVAPRRPGWWRHVPAVALLFALAGLAVATARPVAAVEVPNERATVVLALDTSASMNADDVDPSRLAAAATAASEFAEQLPARFNLALVTFDGTARVTVPATTDHGLVVRALANPRTGGGTAVGDAVLVGLDALLAVPGATETREDAADDDVPPAHLVLLSDGSSNSGQPVEVAAQAASAAAVPVSTIAYGAQDGAGDRGSSPPDTAMLAALAAATGGSAYTATDGRELDAVYEDIGTEIGTSVQEREVWRWFAAAALVLAALGGGFSLLTTPRLP